jgi:hypothetical protein
MFLEYHVYFGGPVSLVFGQFCSDLWAFLVYILDDSYFWVMVLVVFGHFWTIFLWYLVRLLILGPFFIGLRAFLVYFCLIS